MVGVTVDSRATGSRGQLFFVTVWLVVTTMLVVGSQVVSAPQALGDETQRGRVPRLRPTSRLTGPDPAEVGDPSVVYGGMLWTMTDSRIAGVEDGLFGRTAIEVDATLTNTLSSTELRVPDSIGQLGRRRCGR